MRFPGRRRPAEPFPQVRGGSSACPDGGGRELAVPDEHWRDLEERARIAADARTRRVPIAMAGWTLAAGAGSWGSVVMVTVLAGPETGGAAQALVCAGTALGMVTLRRLLAARIGPEWVRRWWTATGAAMVWVDIAATRGPDMLTANTPMRLGAALVIGTAAIGARWFDVHQVRWPEPQAAIEPSPPRPALPPAPEHDAPDVAEAEAFEARWAAVVAAGGKPIAAGSELRDRQRLPHGWRWRVQLDPCGDVGATEMEADDAARAIARRYGMHPNHVMPERLLGALDREDRVSLTVVTRDVLADGVPYRGPSYDRGRVRIGEYADGSGGAYVTIWDEQGMKCGVITGEPGSGKSAAMAGIGIGCRDSDELAVLFADGDPRGRSSRLLGEVAHDFARGPAEALQQLEGIEAMSRVRGPMMGTLTTGEDGRPTPITARGQVPVDKMLPCPAFPGIIWFLDEFHLLADDPDLRAVNFVPRFAKAVRLLRKYGGGFWIGTQSIGSDDFDGDSALRAMIAGGNTLVMGSENRSEQGIVTDGIAPWTLPKGGGYAFQGGSAGRQVMLRVAYSDDMARWAPAVIGRGQPDRRTWQAFQRYRVVRPLDSAADYDDAVAALADFDLAVETGVPLPGSPEARQAAEADDAGPGADLGGPVSVGGFGLPSFDNVLPFHRGERPAPPEREAPALPRPLTAKEQLVLDDLHDRPGPQRSGDVAARTGLSGPDVSKALAELRSRDLVHRPSGRQGSHEITEKGTAMHHVHDAGQDAMEAARERWLDWHDCPGCSATPGGNHHDDCDHAACPECGEQRIQCTEHDDSTRPARWHGVDPRFEMAGQMGWWRRIPDLGPVPDDGRVIEAEARGEIAWVPESQRYARRAAITNRTGAA